MSYWTSTLRLLKPTYTSANQKNKVYKFQCSSQYGSSVLIKQITCLSQEEAKKAVNEAKIAHDYQHPNLCNCIEWEVDENYVYMFFEQMDKSLQEDLDERRMPEIPVRYAEAELWRLFRELLKGFTYLQKLNIAHRDIKPRNILLSNSGQVQICDFGFAKKIDSMDNSLLGTLSFFSPKLKRGWLQGATKVQHNPFKSDVYSLGVVLSYLTFLQIPQLFGSLIDLQENIDKLLSEISNYSSEWVKVLIWMLRVEESQRPDFLQLSEAINNPKPYADDDYLGETTYSDYENPLQIILSCGLQNVRISPSVCEMVPCMLSLKAIPQKTVLSTYEMDLVCVIDESRRMEETGCMELVQRTLISIIEQMRNADRLCVIGYSDEATRKCPLTCCTTEGKGKLEEHVRALTPHDNASLVAGLKMGLEVLKQRRMKNFSATLLLFTSGRSIIEYSSVQEECLKELQNMQKEDLTLHCIGYGEDLDTSLLEEIASKGNGVFSYVNSLGDIPKSFALVFGGISLVVARDIQVKIKVSQGKVPCTLAKVYSKDGSELFRIPEISANQRKDLLFLLMPPHLELTVTIQDVVAKAIIAYVNNEGGPSRQKMCWSIKFIRWASINVDKDQEVFTNWYRVKGGYALREAREMANVGNFQGADRHLYQTIEDLSLGGYAEFPMVANILKDLIAARALVHSNSTWQQGGDTHISSISYSHMSQEASIASPEYASKQQDEVAEKMGAQTYTLPTAALLHAYRQHEEFINIFVHSFPQHSTYHLPFLAIITLFGGITHY